jgi:hypothetical protein
MGTALLLGAAAMAAQQTGIKIFDVGNDGDERFYNVFCPGKGKIVISHDNDAHQVCFYVKGGTEKVCLKTDDLDAVAQRACSTTE